MNREERAQRANEHYNDVKVRLANQTIASIKDTKMYGPNIKTRANSKEEIYEHSLRLADLDSVSCLFSLPLTDEKVCILNYASYKHPGGYFLGGSSAQEEALCHESNLYPILLSFDDTYYDWNKGRLNNGLYLNRALYTPNVVFEHNGETRLADVLTCAAPNFRTAHNYRNISQKQNDEVFKDRINFMLQIIEENHVERFISGAWGCGVFMQNPSTTCELMTNTLINGNYNIPNIYYAIPGNFSSNYRAFEKCLHTIFEK